MINNYPVYAGPGRALLVSVAVVGWIAGAVLAPGWIKLLAILFAPYSWYLTVERIMSVTGLLP